MQTSDISQPRKSSEAGITVTATYLGNGAFNVKLDTHSGTLDYQLDKLSYVRDAEGNVYRPVSWDGGTGSHHVEGTLQFPGSTITRHSGWSSRTSVRKKGF